MSGERAYFEQETINLMQAALDYFVASCRLDIRHWCAADWAEEHTSELVKRKRAAMFRDELGGSFATGRSRDIHRRGVDRTSFQWPRRCLPAAPE